MPPAALMSLAARSSPSLACRPYNSTPPENGSTAPILIGSAEFAHGAAARDAQQIVQRSERAFIERTFISGIPSPITGRIAGARSASYATKGSGKMAAACVPAGVGIASRAGTAPHPRLRVAAALECG